MATDKNQQQAGNQGTQAGNQGSRDQKPQGPRDGNQQSDDSTRDAGQRQGTDRPDRTSSKAPTSTAPRSKNDDKGSDDDMSETEE